MRKSFDISHQAGRTMIETILYISLAAFIAIGFLRLVNTVFERYKVSNVVGDITDLRKALVNRYSAAASYAGVAANTAKLVDERVIPRSIVTSSNTLRHSFGGAIELGTLGDSMADFLSLSGEKDKFLSIRFKGLERKACLALLDIQWPRHDRANVLGIEVGGTKIYWDKTYAARLDSDGLTVLNPKMPGDKPFPLSLADISALCTGDNITITWYFF